MQINVSITLGKGEDLKKSPDETASDVIKACGGDEEVDYCTLHVSQPEPGVAGAPPGPPQPFFVEGPGAE